MHLSISLCSGACHIFYTNILSTGVAAPMFICTIYLCRGAGIYCTMIFQAASAFLTCIYIIYLKYTCAEHPKHLIQITYLQEWLPWRAFQYISVQQHLPYFLNTYFENRSVCSGMYLHYLRVRTHPIFFVQMFCVWKHLPWHLFMQSTHAAGVRYLL